MLQSGRDDTRVAPSAANWPNRSSLSRGAALWQFPLSRAPRGNSNSERAEMERANACMQLEIFMQMAVLHSRFTRLSIFSVRLEKKERRKQKSSTFYFFASSGEYTHEFVVCALRLCICVRRDEGTFSPSEHTTKLCYFRRRRRFLLLLRTMCARKEENPWRRSATCWCSLFVSRSFRATVKSLRMTSSNIYFSVKRACFLTRRNFPQKKSC